VNCIIPELSNSGSPPAEPGGYLLTLKEMVMEKPTALMLAVVLLALPVAALSPVQSLAGEYPSKGRIITHIMPVAAGGGTDIVGRLVAPLIQRDLGVTNQIVNKPGASQQVGLSEAANAKPDGYTLVWTVLPTAASTYLDPERKATFGRKDLQPIALIYGAPFCVSVLSTSPYKTLKELVDAAKANPEKIKAGTTGYMSTGHFANIEFARAAGVKFATVNFDGGGGPELTALLGGHIDVSFNSLGEVLVPSKSGGIRILGVMSKQESEFLPGVKTLEAQGYKAETSVSGGLSAPAGLPKESVDLLANSVRKSMGDENFKKRMAELGYTLSYLPSHEYAAFWDGVDAQLKPLIEIAKKQVQ
jgi:tripartite-type tricarboxylate transporter receptor subunit TctC